MELWLELLFGNWVGLLSMIVIFFMLGMAGYFVWFFLSKSKEPEGSGGA